VGRPKGGDSTVGTNQVKVSGKVSIYVEGLKMKCPFCKQPVEEGKLHQHDISYTSGGKSSARTSGKGERGTAANPTRRKSRNT
jgi:hypothetical protein